MRRTFLAIVVGIVISSALTATSVADQQQASLDPLVVSPDHYRVAFENEYVRVVRHSMQGHDKVPMHHHALSAVMVLVTDQNVRQSLPDGTSREQHRKAGEVFWSQPSTHTGENLSFGR